MVEQNHRDHGKVKDPWEEVNEQKQVVAAAAVEDGEGEGVVDDVGGVAVAAA